MNNSHWPVKKPTSTFRYTDMSPFNGDVDGLSARSPTSPFRAVRNEDAKSSPHICIELQVILAICRAARGSTDTNT
ncbi:hypothetical protein JOB18_014235 [Solea senegalensis]|uniref:Uncharacterized protein n=1 Tax=Solea senegalensis TaxID=28829 RepID=A0AAV6PRN9_SOLSE|nr:hypothetical protein JOB18_014235 [Solea senegalensis]